MKKFYLLLTLIVVTTIQMANAQAPQGIPYQAVARDNAGNLIKNQPISLRFKIHDGSANGAVVYSETHAVTTDALGLFSLNIGGGNATLGTMAGVNWGSGAKFTQVELDVTGGTNYADMGTTQMMSVPYALYAGSSAAAPSVFEITQDNADHIHNTNPGNVGIGTDLPAQKLDVAGNVRVRQNQFVEGFSMVQGDAMVQGNSMIGQNLEVSGLAYISSLTIPSGNPAQGKVLTSDADGHATWQTPASPDLTGYATTAALDASNTQLTSQINDLSTVVSNTNTQVQSNTTAIASLQNQNDVQSSQISTLNDGLSAINTQVQTNTSNISNVQAQTTMLQNGVDNLQLQVQSNSTDIVGLQIQNTEQAQQIDFLNVQNADQSSQISTLNDGLSATNTQVQTNTTDIASLQTQIGNVQSKFITTLDDSTSIYNVNPGNVGIGTDLPSEKLDVAGNLKVRGTIVAGENSSATGINSFSIGRSTIASGVYSTAMGFNTVASGPLSTVFGVSSTASGLHSLATGFGTEASGIQSTTMGGATIASGVRSTAMGFSSNASGDASVAMGTSTTARSNSEVVVGMNNTDYQPGSTEGYFAADRLFVIGNGVNANNKSDAMVVLKNGNTTINGTTTANSFVKAGGQANEYLMADGSTSAGPDLSGYVTNTALDVINSNISNVQAQTTMLQNGVDNLQLQVQSNTTDIVGLQIQNTEQAQQIDFLNVQNADQSFQISTLNDGLSATNTQVQTNTTDITSLQTQIGNVQSKFITTLDDPTSIYNVNPGNVGIGTDLPSEKLDVAGNLKVRENMTLSGTLNNMNVGNLGTGSGNVVFGGSAFNANASADDNTAIGNGAMANTTSGNNNVAVGAYALVSNTTGFWNNAIGWGSLSMNTTGFQNIGLGFGTLGTNTTGSQNTAIGNQSDVSSSDLNNATAIGNGAIVDASNKIQLGNTDVTDVNTSGTYTGAGFKTPNGTSSEYLMADGSTSTGGSSTSMGSIGVSSTANGATITSGVLSLTPADGTNGGIVTSSAQTFGGKKTFADSAVAKGFRATDSITTKGFRATGTAIANSVGIGTNAPTEKLEVDGNIKGSGRITSNASAYGITHKYGNVEIATYIQDDFAGWFGTKSNHPLWFYTNDGYSMMALTTTGKVGIGINDPSEKLDVNGNLKVRGTATADIVSTSAFNATGTAGADSVSTRALKTTGNAIVGGNLISFNPTNAAINATATATAANIISGYITSTSAAATTITLPTATAIATALGTVTRGTQLEFTVDNVSGAQTVTIALGTGITAITPVIAGTNTLTVSVANGIGRFRLVFTSATAAKIIRVF